MDLRKFLATLASDGIALWLEGEQLRYRAPKGGMTPEIIATLKEYKAELLAILAEPVIQPLSYAQKALYFLWQQAPTSAAYNVAFAAQIHDTVNVEALQQALQTLLQRHAVLRTTVVLRDGEPVAEVQQNQALSFDVIDAPDWPEEVITDAVRTAYQRPFDLEHGPLVCVSLFAHDQSHFTLLFTAHHIVLDALSFGTLFAELGQLYPTLAADQQVVLPAQTHTYADFVHWGKEMLQAEGERLWRYWRDQLADAPAALDLHTDFLRPAAPSYAGTDHPFQLSTELTQQLKQLAREQGVTLYAVLLAGFHLLLHRYTGQRDITVGAPIGGRSNPEFVHLVGDFVNSVALRANFGESLTVGSLLAETHETLLGALEHQDYPFPLLVERLQLPRDPSRSPLFQVMFNLQAGGEQSGLTALGMAPSYVKEPIRWAGLTLTPVNLAQQQGQLDLTLELIELDGTLVGSCKYATDLFSIDTIARMAGHFQTLLAGMVADPTQSIAELPLLTDAERQQLLINWNETTADYPEDKCIHHLFEEQAARTPDKIALIFDEGDTQESAERATRHTREPAGRATHLTYRELNERANQLAYHLQALGVEPENLVGLYADRSPEMLWAMLGILKAGAAYVPLDPTFPAERIGYMIEDAQLPLILTQQHLFASLPTHEAQTFLLDADQAAITNYPIANPTSAVTPDHLIYVIYTSGSTGQPKGVQLCHRSVANFLAAMQREPGLTAEDTLLAVTTLSFDIAVLELYLPLLTGAQVLLTPQAAVQDGEQLQQLIQRHNVTVMQATPATWRLLLASGWQGNADLKILCGGEALPTELATQLAVRGRELWNMYGPTETTVWSTTRQIVTPAEEMQGEADVIDPREATEFIGRPIANTQIYIVDQSMQPTPVGVAGELLIGGDGLARGYLHRPELTAKKFIANPFGSGKLYRTGDLARYLPSGDIEFLGRLDHQVKLRGFRIELGEIEAALLAHESVQNAVVVARPDHAGDKQLVAYMIPKSDQGATATISPSGLRTFLQQTLPAYMIPAAFVPLERFPLTPNNKIDRRALPDPVMRTQVESTYTKPDSALEEMVVVLWQEALHVEQVGIHDNFFELGGHSLLLVNIHRQLAAQIDQPLTIVDLFRYPTIHALCQYLEPNTTSQPAQRSGRSRPTQQAEDQEIAIVGMAVRFPGAPSIDAFWQNLRDGVESITHFSDEELLNAGVDPTLLTEPTYIKTGAVLEEIDRFDADFFDFSNREAELLDPQIRLFLECAWEALEDANCDPLRYPGPIGVYAGSGENSYLENNLQATRDLAGSWSSYYNTWVLNGKDFLATRLAYKLNLTGPAITIQTACSTSLVATHLACQSLHSGECDMALAGGVTISIPHRIGYHYEEGMVFSPDGHCRAFDAQAAGTFFGSGMGIVALKRLPDALADGDRIHAVIKGSAINNDGANKVGYTAPSVEGQITAITQALRDANVDPATITYIETHGTGTQLGDPIELTALREVFQARTTQPTWEKVTLGAVKTNFGHLDTAAGVAGLIKTVLALKHQQLPPTLHFTEPNPRLDFPADLFAINTQVQPWPANGTPRRAGVSSFGIGGTNAHVVLEETPSTQARSPIDGASCHSPVALAPGERNHHLLTLSAKTDAALRAMAAQYRDFLATADDTSLADICYTSHIGRSHFAHRLSVVGESPASVQEQLSAYLAGNEDARICQGDVAQDHSAPKIAFLFTGQGAQYIGMGRELYETEPAFRATLDRCDAVFQECWGRSLLELIYPATEPEHNNLFDSTPCAQATNLALECALADLWRSWGVAPAVVVGHSLGDFAAAYTAGVLTVEDGIRMVTERGRLIDTAVGSMVSVLASEADVTPYIADYDDVTIGVINGPKGIVISGGRDEVALVTENLQAAGFKARTLAIPVAGHSPMLDPVLDEFEAVVRTIPLSPPTLPVVSSMTGQLVTEELTDPIYWRQQMRQTVRFADAIQTVHEQGCTIFLEIGPKPTLLGIAQAIYDFGFTNDERHVTDATLVNPLLLPSLRGDCSDWQQLLESLGELYVHGVAIDWEGLDHPSNGDGQRRKVALPTYPFQRQRHWITPKPKGQAGTTMPLIDKMINAPALGATLLESTFSVDTLPYLVDHQVFDTVVSPAACQLAMVLNGRQLAMGDQPWQLEDVVLPQALVLPNETNRVAQLAFTPSVSNGSAVHTDIKLISTLPNQGEQPATHVTGRLASWPEATMLPDLPESSLLDLDAWRTQCTEPVDLDVLYAASQVHGLVMGPSFRWVAELWRSEDAVLGRLLLPTTIDDLVDHVIHPGLLDGCFNVIAMGQQTPGEVRLPFALDTLRLYQPIFGSAWWCYAKRHEGDKWMLQLADSTGQLVAEIEGYAIRTASPDAIRPDEWREWLYTVDWELTPLPEEVVANDAAPENDRYWLLLADEQGVAETVAEQLRSHGDNVVCLYAGVLDQADSARGMMIQPQNAEEYHRLLATLPTVTDVVHCWSLDDTQTADGRSSCETTLYLVQALLQERTTPPRLWLVTRGAQATSTQDGGTGIAQSALWGLGKTIALEHPELNCVCIDLDDRVALADQIPQFYAELRTSASTANREQQIALRGNGEEMGRLVARLHRFTPQPTEPLPIHADATYLITGGLGGLGLSVAAWLVEQGARHLMLVGRSQPRPDAQAQIDALLAQDAAVQVIQADVSDASQVETALASVEETYPLRGVIHAAGVLADGTLLQQTAANFDTVFAPKVNGAWHLHCLTETIQLDFFVLFSSITSLLGGAGQANHAAANAWLDALAHYRQAQGLPALSINWGAWSEVGAAAEMVRTQAQQLAASGFGTIAPHQGLQVLATLLGEPVVQVGCLPIRWPQYLQQENAATPFVQRMATQVASQHSSVTVPTKAEPSRFQQRLTAASPTQRKKLLVAHLQSLVTVILGLTEPPDPADGLFDLGMTSLMLLDFKNRIEKSMQVSVASTIAFEYPSVDALATYLFAEVLALDDEGIAGDVDLIPETAPSLLEPESGNGAHDDLDDLSEDELAQLLAEKLS